MCVCMYVPVLGILASFIGRVDNILHDLFLFQQGVSVQLLGSQIMCMYVCMHACMYICMYGTSLGCLCGRPRINRTPAADIALC